MSSQPKYKLSYFAARGIGEPIRYILSYLELEFEDKRFNYPDEEWQKAKSSYPWGTLPVLEEDNYVISQSLAICRYLGRKYKLAGDDERESGRIDEYIDTIKDYFLKTYPLYGEKDEKKIKELQADLMGETSLKYLPKLERDLKANGGQFIVGSRVTWGDFVLAQFLENLKYSVSPDLYKDYPAIRGYMEGIFNIPQIKAWIAKRPQTQY